MSDLTNFQPRQERGIDRLFDKVKLSYGSLKMAQMLDGLDVEAVKQNWIEELRRGRYGEARIHKAIENMVRVHPSWPPTIGEFLALCEAAASEMPRVEYKNEVAQVLQLDDLSLADQKKRQLAHPISVLSLAAMGMVKSKQSIEEALTEIRKEDFPEAVPEKFREKFPDLCREFFSKAV